MKKILTSIALVAALCACNKEKELAPAESQAPDTGKQIITATVNVASKVAYSENTPGGGGGISSVWEEGDTFYAIQDGERVVTFTLSDGAGNSTAEFTAETEGATASTSWVAVLGKKATVVNDSEIHCSFKGQNGSISNLDKFNYVKAEGTGLEPVFDFENGEKLSYIMRVKLPAGIKCIEYTPSAYWKVTASETKDQYYTPSWYNVNDSMDAYAFAAFQPENTSVITLSSASSSGQIIYISVPAINYSYTAPGIGYSKTSCGNIRSGVIVTIMNNNSDNADASNGSVLNSDLRTKGGQIGTFDMSGMQLMTRPKPSDAVTLTALNYTSKFSNTPQKAENRLVTKWSPINLGATEPYEQGGLYSFGEINPRESFVLSEHTNYGHASGFYDVITAGDNLGGGITYTMAGTKYDAARVKWGVAWRMPHALELEALGQKSTRSDETLSGVTCLKLELDGGSYIYLPLQTGTFYTNLGYSDNGPWKAKVWAQSNACTFLRGADQYQRGSNTGTENTDKAWFFSFLSKASETANNASGSQGDYWQGNYNHRYYGMPIRPVLASSEWLRD